MAVLTATKISEEDLTLISGTQSALPSYIAFWPYTGTDIEFDDRGFTPAFIVTDRQNAPLDPYTVYIYALSNSGYLQYTADIADTGFNSIATFYQNPDVFATNTTVQIIGADKVMSFDYYIDNAASDAGVLSGSLSLILSGSYNFGPIMSVGGGTTIFCPSFSVPYVNIAYSDDGIGNEITYVIYPLSDYSGIDVKKVASINLSLGILTIYNGPNFFTCYHNGATWDGIIWEPSDLLDPDSYSVNDIVFDDAYLNNDFQNEYGVLFTDGTYFYYVFTDDSDPLNIYPVLIQINSDWSGYRRYNLVAGDTATQSMFNEIALFNIFPTMAVENGNLYLTGGDETLYGMWYSINGFIGANDRTTKRPTYYKLPCISNCIPFFRR